MDERQTERQADDARAEEPAERARADPPERRGIAHVRDAAHQRREDEWGDDHLDEAQE